MGEPSPQSPSRLNHALHLAADGFYVLPLRAGQKLPAFKGWQKIATRDPQQIKTWFDGSDYNIGIFTGRFGDDEALLVVDVDVKGAKNGNAELLKLECAGYELPDTRTHHTPTGGRHLIFRVASPVRSSVGAIGRGLDVRSASGLIVGPGSRVEAGTYESAGGEIARGPDWLLERAGAVRPKREIADPPAKVSSERARNRASRYLKDEAPPSIEGQGGNDNAYKVACCLKDLGVDRGDAPGLMLGSPWNERCEPPWGPDELSKIVDSAYEHGQNPFGIAAPEADFEPIPEQPQDNPFAWVDRLNQLFFVVNEGGRVTVFRPTVDHALGREVLERISFEDMKRMFQNDLVGVGVDKAGRAILRNKAEAWLAHPKRRQYLNGVAFIPGADTPTGVYNLWRGLAIKPVRGCWDLLRWHILNVICAGDAVADRYVIGWIARLLQRPGEQGQVALVLRGGRGTGKGTLGNALVRIFGQHALYVANAKHLVGQFNAHLRDCCFLFADEAFYAGDKQQESTLKTLITEPHILIEPKFQNAVTARNVAHLLLASNSDWVVPAGLDERRFCVLNVSDSHQRNIPYFEKLNAEMERGGLAAMLHDLLEYDLSTFNVFDVPQTAGLTEQKVQSLRGVSAWLLSCLQTGSMGTNEWTDHGLAVTKAEAYRAYLSSPEGAKEFTVKDISTWSRSVKRLLAGCWEESRGQRSTAGRQRQLLLHGLSKCRKAFEQHVGVLEWETEAEASPHGFTVGGAHANLI